MSLPRYSSYKDSGVEWLGEVPSHWNVGQSRRMFAQRKERARDDDQQLTASQKYGVIFQTDFMEIEGARVVQVIHGADILKHVEPNDFVISMRSFQGGIEWCPNRGSISSAYVMLIPNDSIVPSFFKYLFKSSTYIQALQSTTNLVRDGQALRYENFTLVDLPILPLGEQAAIAEFLDRETGKIDALVAEQERLIALLTEKRQAVISHAVTKGLNPTAPMKPSDIDWLGDIPAHWGVAALKHIANIATGYAFNSDLFVENGVPVIRIGDILLSGSIDIASAKCIVADDLSLYEKYLVQKNDILMAMTGATIGKAGWFDSEQSALLNQRVCYFRAKENAAQRYIWYVLATHFYCEYLRLTAFGGAQPNISDGQLVSCIVCIPTFDEQSAIAEFLDQETSKFDDLIVEAEMAITILQERRTALISAAVTGKIDVRGQARKEKAA